MAMKMDRFHPRLTENSKSWTFLEQRGWVSGAAELLDYEASGGSLESITWVGGLCQRGRWMERNGEREGQRKGESEVGIGWREGSQSGCGRWMGGCISH